MKATYVDHMGSDLNVVNAARVSFRKKHDVFDEDKDSRLIRFLARHNHWTPFGHTSVTIHCEAPIFVARQLGKHQVGLVWNEVSRRYVDDMPDIYHPELGWRRRADDKKQGSNQHEFVTNLKYWSGRTESAQIDDVYGELTAHALSTYRLLLDNGVCPEQARMVLPQSAYTEWYWTGSVAAFARVCNLRLKEDTQKETRDIAEDIAGICAKLFPVSWNSLTGEVQS